MLFARTSSCAHMSIEVFWRKRKHSEESGGGFTESDAKKECKILFRQDFALLLSVLIESNISAG